jgi:hypothetical protein
VLPGTRVVLHKELLDYPMVAVETMCLPYEGILVHRIVAPVQTEIHAMSLKQKLAKLLGAEGLEETVPTEEENQDEGSTTPQESREE